MFTCPFIVDRSDNAMHSSQRSGNDDRANSAAGSLDASARVGCRGRNERERREASSWGYSWRELD